MADEDQDIVNWIRLDGEKLDIPSGDVSAYEPKLRNLIAAGGGWLRTMNGITTGYEWHWVGPSSSVTIHYRGW